MNRFWYFINRLIPYPIRRLISLLRFVARNPGRWPGIFLAGTPEKGKLCVFYGFDHIPGADELAHGGMVKYQLLQKVFPNSPRRFNIQYLVSSAPPGDWPQLLWLTRRKRAWLVLNQNGVWYPACYGLGWKRANIPMKKMLHAADYVFYQSRFCKLSADLFLGERHESLEILYNPVDTAVFTPADSDPDPNHLVLLLGGTQYPYYRFEYAARMLAILARCRSDVRLLVTGRLGWMPEHEVPLVAQRLVTDLGIANRVEFIGPYTQAEAPAILQRAHLLLHTKYNDPCPGIVIEAMACGLPVIYSKSGGVPELVGEAGIGVPAELSWEKEIPPDPKELAEAVLRVAERRKEYAEAARERAVEHFDLKPWIKRHHEVFGELLCK